MLGVVTEATLRLLPLPPARAALSCGFVDIRAAAAAVQAVFAAGWLPAALEIADRFTLEAARAHVGVRKVPAGEAHLLLELDGRESSLRGEIEELRGLLLGVGGLAPETALNDDCERLWDLRRAFSESLKATGLTKLNEDLVVPRGRLVDLIDFAGELQARYGVPVACFGHAGDGNIHVNLMAAGYHERAEVRENVDRALDELFTQILAWGGAITGEHGVGLAKRRWFDRALSAENRALHRRLKDALDPAGVLNPDKFLG